jgi:adenine-specific DNA-methyltransferase
MPELLFKGKEYVYNHHLTVPYRPLLPDAAKSVGPAALDGNLIVHGDNLHALKALLPRYAGQVDLVFIDPPYNTGNEGWCYSDNLRAPFIQEWLSSNPVGIEDSLRHDKWLAMMWPRLTLLRELLSERGSLWMTLDDNEVHRARAMLDEVFGAENFVAVCVWQRNYSPKNTAQFFSEDHDYVLVVAKNKELWRPRLLERTAEMEARYGNPDNDPRGPWKASDLSARNFYSEGTYPIDCPGGRRIDGPPPGTYWRVKRSKFHALDAQDRIYWGEDKNNVPAIKRFLSEVKQGRVPQTLWFYKDVGHTQDAKKQLLDIGVLRGEETTITPKPVGLVERVLDIGADDDALILDSFAGSGTTAHAVLKANAADNGSRRFILVEGEDYADRLTAERVRRVIGGYAWEGTQREELLNERLTWTQLQKADQLLAKVQAIKVREGFADGDLADQGAGTARRFDKITAKVVDGALVVEGERRIDERAPGTGGEFTYCTLGEPLDVEKMLSGESLPDRLALGAWLFHTATGATLPAAATDAPEWYLAEAQDRHVWLVYRPDRGFLTSPEAALTLTLARRIGAWSRAQGGSKKSLVFAPAKYLSNRQLAEDGVEFAALPFALYREG